MAAISNASKEMFLLGKQWLAIRDAGTDKFSWITQKQPGIFTDSDHNIYDVAKLELVFLMQKEKAAAEKDLIRKKFHEEQISILQTFRWDAMQESLPLYDETLDLKHVQLKTEDDSDLANAEHVKRSLLRIELAKKRMPLTNMALVEDSVIFSKCNGLYFAVLPNLCFLSTESSKISPGINLETRQWAVVSMLYDKPSAKKDQNHRVFKYLSESPQLQAHPNLVRIFGVYECQINNLRMSHCWMKMCMQGNTYDRWVLGKDFISVGELNKLFAEMIAACQTLHAHNIVHRDLKSENVLLDDGSYKLGDFDLSHLFKDPNKSEILSLSGNIITMAPEIANRSGGVNFDFTLKELILADIYELGATVFEIGTKTALPWHEKPESARELKEALSIPHPQLICDRAFPEPVNDLRMHAIWECVRLDPNKRPSLEELKGKLK